MKPNAIRVKSGHLVDPFNLQKSDLSKIDFIHSISILNRYTGHSKYPYSVGQHTLILAMYVPDHLKKTAFIHDFSEALFNDIASPVKVRFQEYKDAEEKAQRIIFDYYNVPWETMEEFNEYDKRIFMDERNVLFDTIIENGSGMGDERKLLGIPPVFFREMNWKDVKDRLERLYLDLFSQGFKISA